MGGGAQKLPFFIHHLANGWGSDSCPRDDVCVSVCDKDERAAVEEPELREELLVIECSSIGTVVVRRDVSGDEGERQVGGLEGSCYRLYVPCEYRICASCKVSGGGLANTDASTRGEPVGVL
jgi:hypothetical protein